VQQARSGGQLRRIVERPDLAVPRRHDHARTMFSKASPKCGSGRPLSFDVLSTTRADLGISKIRFMERPRDPIAHEGCDRVVPGFRGTPRTPSQLGLPKHHTGGSRKRYLSGFRGHHAFPPTPELRADSANPKVSGTVRIAQAADARGQLPHDFRRNHTNAMARVTAIM
jgi:hypothetical protein